MIWSRRLWVQIPQSPKNLLIYFIICLIYLFLSAICESWGLATWRKKYIVFAPVPGLELGLPDPETDDIPMCHHASLWCVWCSIFPKYSLFSCQNLSWNLKNKSKTMEKQIKTAKITNTRTTDSTGPIIAEAQNFVQF